MKKEIKNAIILTITVITFLLIVYLVVAINKGEIGRSKKFEAQNTGLSLSYDNMINAKNVFDQDDEEYYVIFFSEKDVISAVKQAFSSYSGNIKLYKVNFDEAINKYIVSNDENKNPTTSDDIKVNKTTLIKINNGIVVSYITDSVEIINELK